MRTLWYPPKANTVGIVRSDRTAALECRPSPPVAAYLEPEIVIVDEVLAVGDAAFQQKCLGKMGIVARSGRTVLLVSHQYERDTFALHTMSHAPSRPDPRR